MRIMQWLKTVPGRIARVLLGATLLWVGHREQTVNGLLLMMLGLVPLCTGFANICLMDDLATAIDVYWRPHREHLPRPRA